MSYDKEIITDILQRIHESISDILRWNCKLSTEEDYASSPEGMKTLAATCMLLEAIGEGVKKIERHTDGKLLQEVCPDIPWKNIMGMRDHIAHGYFNIDIEFVYCIVRDDLHPLQKAVGILINHLNT